MYPPPPSYGATGGELARRVRFHGKGVAIQRIIALCDDDFRSVCDRVARSADVNIVRQPPDEAVGRFDRTLSPRYPNKKAPALKARKTNYQDGRFLRDLFELSLGYYADHRGCRRYGTAQIRRGATLGQGELSARRDFRPTKLTTTQCSTKSFTNGDAVVSKHTTYV